MGFRFSLETVLRLRRSLEDNERLRLQSLLVNRAQLDRAIDETTASRTAVDENLKQSLGKGTLPGGEMHFVGQRLAACDLQSVRLNASRANLTQQIELQQVVLLRRRLDRKVLEQLRQRQLARYEADAERRTQAQIEELFLLRRERKNN
jgi:flagellar export protein FliJ